MDPVDPDPDSDPEHWLLGFALLLALLASVLLLRSLLLLAGVCAAACFFDAAWVPSFAVSLLLQALPLLLDTWLLQASLFLLLLVSLLLLGSWLLQASLLRLCAFAVSCRYTVGSLAAVLALAPK